MLQSVTEDPPFYGRLPEGWFHRRIGYHFCGPDKKKHQLQMVNMEGLWRPLLKTTQNIPLFFNAMLGLCVAYRTHVELT